MNDKRAHQGSISAHPKGNKCYHREDFSCRFPLSPSFDYKHLCPRRPCITWGSLFTRLVQLLIVGSSCPTNQSTFVAGLYLLQETALAREGISELDADSFKGCRMCLQLIPHRQALTGSCPRPFIRGPSPHAYYTIGGLRWWQGELNCGALSVATCQKS